MFREMRRKRQQVTQEAAEEMLLRGSSGILAVSGDDGYPYAVPVNYVYESGRIYFHCALQGHKLDGIAANEKVSFCVVAQDEVVAEEFTDYYRSVIAFGRAAVVEESGEKEHAMDLLVRKYAPAYEEEGAQYIAREWNALHVVRIQVEHLTGKVCRELMG